MRLTRLEIVVGEAFRPVVAPWIVRAAYGVSWTYLFGDVAYETYKARRRGPSPLEAATYSEPTRLAMVAVQRSVFQSVASMYVRPVDFGMSHCSLMMWIIKHINRALPAFTIHSIVR